MENNESSLFDEEVFIGRWGPAGRPLREVLSHMSTNYEPREVSGYRVIASSADARESAAKNASHWEAISQARGVPLELGSDFSAVTIEADSFKGEAITAKVLKTWVPGSPSWTKSIPVSDKVDKDFREMHPIGTARHLGDVMSIRPAKVEVETWLGEQMLRPQLPAGFHTAAAFEMDPPLEGRDMVVLMLIVGEHFPHLMVAPAMRMEEHPEHVEYVTGIETMTGSMTGSWSAELAFRFAGKHGYHLV